MPYAQEQMFLVTASVDGVSIGVFDTFDGGDVDSDTKTYLAGGMVPPEALPSPPATGDVTIDRGFKGERDGPLKRWLNSRSGHEIVIGKQPLNPDKTPVPESLETFRGKIKTVSGPSHNSQGTDVSRLKIVATIDGLPS